MKAAIYARKSKDTEKGESMESQINRCIALCDMRGWEYEIYEDFDISGATLERPGFEKMMKDIEAEEFTALICYKLDRVSRSTSDFSTLIKELDEINVDFISIKENFDLSTPMGRAMMMVTSVFAQLERETIAERVRDNMIDRAKMGKWNGGVTPYGYDKYTETIKDGERVKKISTLVISPQEAAVVRVIFENYLKEGQSLRSTVKFMNDSGFRTRNDKLWANNQISRILQNAVYCIADEKAYEYFVRNTEVNVIDRKEDFTGDSALLYYNRRKPHKKTTRKRDEKDWILSIGEHKGIVSSDSFVAAQIKMTKNKAKGSTSGHSTKTPLSGLVKCGKCGGLMTISASPKSTCTSKGYHVYFRCRVAVMQSNVLCEATPTRADVLENKVIQSIFDFIDNEKLLNEVLSKKENTIDNERVPLLAMQNKQEKRLKQISSELDNLLNALASNTLPQMIIQKKYNELEKEKAELKKDLSEITNKLNQIVGESFSFDKFKEYLYKFKDEYYLYDIKERQNILKQIIKEIVVTDDNFKVVLFNGVL